MVFLTYCLLSVLGSSILPWPKTAQIVNDYACECGKSYKIKGNLNRHKKYQCGQERLFSCTICSKRFSFKFHAQEHVKIVHSMRDPDNHVEGP